MANKSEETSKGKRELLSRDIFMVRLGITKSTLFTWRKQGWLVQGRHFVKIHKQELYLWDLDKPREIGADPRRNPLQLSRERHCDCWALLERMIKSARALKGIFRQAKPAEKDVARPTVVEPVVKNTITRRLLSILCGRRVSP